jgi:transcription antitermination factor NusA-like protein
MERHLTRVGRKHEALAAALQDILVTRRQGVKDCWGEWEQLFEQRHEDLRHFTVMLFGRTMAGKSTTLEALAGGDGGRIGEGVPDFTRNIEAVEWEGLRVVDTPGIEGFSKETIGAADVFMDRSDIVAFIISDDHIEPQLLERLVRILNRRTPLLILLNIKAGRLGRLLRSPDRVFRREEIDGHTRRIRGYLQQALVNEEVFIDVDSVPVIAYCAEAANAARNDTELDDDTRQRLFAASRFTEVMNALVATVLERGLSIRTLAAYESFMVNLEQVEDGLRVELARVLSQVKAIQQSKGSCSDMFRRLLEDGKQAFLDLRTHFYSVDAKIDAFVDRVIDERLSNPKPEFDLLLDMPTVRARMQEIGAQCMEIVVERINEFQRQSRLDFSLAASLALDSFVIDASIDADGLDWADIKKWTGKWGKIVGAPAAGLVAGAAATWAVANWWNPSGWIAAGVALLATAAGAAGVGAVSQAIQDSGKADIERARAELRAKLRRQCEEICEKHVITPAFKWLSKEISAARKVVEDGLVTLEGEIMSFVDAAGRFVTALERNRCDAAHNSINAVLPLVLSDWALAQLEVVAVARRITYRTKIAVRGMNGRPAAGLVVGRGGETIRRLSDQLSGQGIDIVEVGADASQADAVRAALFPAHLRDAHVEIVGQDVSATSLAHVYAPSEEEARRAYGRHKWNLRLAEALLNCKIHIHTATRTVEHAQYARP